MSGLQPPSHIPPCIGETVHFLPDATLCEVIGTLPEVKPHPIFALRHPRHGDILVNKKAFVFPLGSTPDAPVPKVFCSQCRWHHEVPLQKLTGSGHDSTDTDVDSSSWPTWQESQESSAPEQTIPICREPGRVGRSPMDYVIGARVPLNCYEINALGDCGTFQTTPTPPTSEDES